MRDVETAQRYGEQHADEFVGVRFVNTPRVRLAVAFTGSLARHCENLRALLEHPEAFELWHFSRGESVSVPVRFATGACELTHGYSLPAGSYHVRATIDIHRNDGDTTALSTPAPLEIHG